MTAGVGRWVCFDVGEVLVDESRVWSAWAVHLGTTPLTLMAALGAAIASGASHQTALERFGVTDLDAGEQAMEAILGGLSSADLYPDALPALDALRDAGYRVAVAGNQPARRTAELRSAGVDTEVLVTSEELGAEKPSPAFFDATLGLLGGPDPAAVAYVGDRVDNDVQPASAFGLRSVWLRRGPWGVLHTGSGVGADLEVGSLTELVARIEEAWS